MTGVKKMSTPLKRGEDYVYPPTVFSQVHADDNLYKTLDQVIVRNDMDVLTLEEIEASTADKLIGKVPNAEAFRQLNSDILKILSIQVAELIIHGDSSKYNIGDTITITNGAYTVSANFDSSLTIIFPIYCWAEYKICDIKNGTQRFYTIDNSKFTWEINGYIASPIFWYALKYQSGAYNAYYGFDGGRIESGIFDPTTPPPVPNTINPIDVWVPFGQNYVRRSYTDERLTLYLPGGAGNHTVQITAKKDCKLFIDGEATNIASNTYILNVGAGYPYSYNWSGGRLLYIVFDD